MAIIKIENLNHVYSEGTPYEKKALSNINLEINSGDFIGLIGHTGSGKSTLVQHLNGLLKPTSGKIYVDGEELFSDKTDMIKVREKVGLVFQYPEYQLFEETIYKDIAFGPKNLGLSDEEVDERVMYAVNCVGLEERMLKKSPFEISGGQKRRVAIAGVLAMKPKVLVLDEPTAGLDPYGRDEILNEINLLHKEGITIILVSHSMEDISKYANRVLVMNNGELAFDDETLKIFEKTDELQNIGLRIPKVLEIIKSLEDRGIHIEPTLDIDVLKEDLLSMLGGKNA